MHHLLKRDSNTTAKFRSQWAKATKQASKNLAGIGKRESRYLGGSFPSVSPRLPNGDWVLLRPLQKHSPPQLQR